MAEKLGISTGKGFVEKDVYEEYADSARHANKSGVLDTDSMAKPTYNNITEDGLYCVVVKYENDTGDTDFFYITMMIYVQSGVTSMVADANTGLTLIYEDNAFSLVTANDMDFTDRIHKCYLMCKGFTLG